MPGHLGDRKPDVPAPEPLGYSEKTHTWKDSELLSDQLRHVSVSQSNPGAPAWAGLAGRAGSTGTRGRVWASGEAPAPSTSPAGKAEGTGGASS